MNEAQNFRSECPQPLRSDYLRQLSRLMRRQRHRPHHELAALAIEEVVPARNLRREWEDQGVIHGRRS